MSGFCRENNIEGRGGVGVVVELSFNEDKWMKFA